MFRSKALRKQSSPDRLDALSQVVRPSSWWFLGALGVGMVLFLVWACTCPIPISVECEGILIVPQRVVPLQAPAEGVVKELKVRAGETVHQGQELVTLALDDLELKLRQAQDEVQGLRERNDSLAQLEREIAGKIEQSLRGQKVNLLAASEELKEFEVTGSRMIAEHLDAQGATLVAAMESAEKLDQEYGQLEELLWALQSDGNETTTAVLELKADRTRNVLALSSLRGAQEELELQRLQDDRSRTELGLRRLELDTRITEIEARIERLSLELELDRVRRAEELMVAERRWSGLQQTYQERSRLSCPHDGKVLEVTVTAGERVWAGQRIGRLDLDTQGAMEALLFFPVEDGKKVQVDQRILITPSTVQRERSGSIEAVVTQVSDYAVSTDAAASEIGDRELARGLVGGRNMILVRARLRSEGGALQWTGTRPALPITAGTTARGRIVVERVLPAHLLLGIARSALGRD